VYYHYTNPQSAESIIRSGVIKKSTNEAKRGDDARHGSGVYLTQVPPTTPRHWIAFNNYDSVNPGANARMVQKGEYADTVTCRLGHRAYTCIVSTHCCHPKRL